jgi:hypothetical protein
MSTPDENVSIVGVNRIRWISVAQKVDHSRRWNMPNLHAQPVRGVQEMGVDL